MENKIVKTFENMEFGKIRTILRDNEVWFIAKDLSVTLEYSDTFEMIKRLEDEDKMILTIENIKNLHIDGFENSTRGITIINESGVYTAIFGSKKYEAKKFKKWITSEVLPSIRKTGVYDVSQIPSYQIEDPIDRAKAWIEEHKAKKELEENNKMQAIELKIKDEVIEEKETKLIEQKPMVDFAETISNSADSIDIGTFAKVVNDENIPMGRNKLFEWLRNKGYLMKNNEPYQKYVNEKYFEVEEYSFKTPYGTKLATKTSITGLGQIKIIQRLKKEFNIK